MSYEHDNPEFEVSNHIEKVALRSSYVLVSDGRSRSPKVDAFPFSSLRTYSAHDQTTSSLGTSFSLNSGYLFFFLLPFLAVGAFVEAGVEVWLEPWSILLIRFLLEVLLGNGDGCSLWCCSVASSACDADEPMLSGTDL